MYNSNPEQLRQGLVNYIGAMVETSAHKGRDARHSVAAVLVEEALKLAKEEEEQEIDFFVAKPVLRGTMFVLEKRADEMAELPETTEIRNIIKSYRTIVSRIKKLVEELK